MLNKKCQISQKQKMKKIKKNQKFFKVSALLIIIVISIIWILMPIFTYENVKIKTIVKRMDYANGGKSNHVILEDDTHAFVSTDAKINDIVRIYNTTFFNFPSNKQNPQQNSDSYFGYNGNAAVWVRMFVQFIIMIIYPGIYLYVNK